MKKIALVVDDFYQKNKIFDINDKIVNRDNCQIHYIKLKEYLSLYNINISTVDINDIEVSDIVIFINMPSQDNEYYKKSKKLRKKIYVIINELDLIHTNNKHRNWIQADKVFTYQDDFVDNKAIFKLNYSFIFPKQIEQKVTFNNKKLAVLIAGNKNIKDIKELYSKRREIIRWFEKNRPNDFDLFGTNWDKYTFRSDCLIGKALNKVSILRTVFHKPYLSYRGKVENKIETMQNYKFCICYENAKDINGWITEKIFDCFFAGIVPIYLGAPNIEKYIPKDCFINMNNFKTYEDFYGYLNNMDKNIYEKYLKEINKFLLTIDEKYEFSVEYYIKTIFNQIKIDMEIN